MRIGIVLLNFGEPEHPTEAEVIPFLERIFRINASLEPEADPARVAARAAELARRRAPTLIEEYRSIGGSPLNAQARAQRDALREALERRGHDARVYVAMQFTDPDIPKAVADARSDGVDRLIGLPVYPLAGPSTTVAGLATLAKAVEDAGWDVPLLELSGWHRHPLYIAIRADTIRQAAASAGLALNGRARLVFSAHGTPMVYLRQGNRYDVYVEDCCRLVAEAAGATSYEVGFQNHTNRPVAWTQPDIERVIDELDTAEVDAVLVDAISYMHEQSETLAELDHELRSRAESRGLAFHRVPVPHDDPRFADVLADVVESGLVGAPFALGNCLCRGPALCMTAEVRRPAGRSPAG